MLYADHVFGSTRYPQILIVSKMVFISPELGLAGDHQQINASLAVQVCRAWLQEKGKVNGKCISHMQGCTLRTRCWVLPLICSRGSKL